MPNLGTIHDVAATLRIHEKSVYRWMRKDPTFPRPFRLARTVNRWDLDAVAAWIRTRATN